MPTGLSVRTEQRNHAGDKKNGEIVVLGRVCCNANKRSNKCQDANQPPMMAEDAHN
jgi:hypothetical protein